MRILLIDGDKGVREDLRKKLEEDYFVVDTASDGNEGSYKARIHDYDAVILDSVLDKRKGVEVCRDMRAMGKTAPILVLSSRSEIDDKVALLDSGADDYLTKPYAYKELMSRLRAVLRRPLPIAEHILQIDDLVIDTINHKALRAGRDLRLTKKEFALAEYLLQNVGRAISRTLLLEHVWGDDIDPFSNTVEAHILNLRKKIDQPSASKLIHTVPGQGYKIDFMS